jgi:pyridoxal phosphate enzyme (YggS family)
LTPLSGIKTRLHAAAAESGRKPEDVSLIAVSKTQSREAVLALLAEGQTVFGENRVQEAEEKFSGLAGQVTLHLIGPLQTNKVKKAAALFDVIETLDRPALAEELARLPRCPELFIQVNTGEESQKAGVLPSGLADLLALSRSLGLPVTGLMCIPPADEPAAPHFAFLALLAKRYGLANLSMGMSADFESAISLGATHVRVGTALFGER